MPFLVVTTIVVILLSPFVVMAQRLNRPCLGMDPTEVKRIIATGGASSNKAILQVWGLGFWALVEWH